MTKRVTIKARRAVVALCLVVPTLALADLKRIPPPPVFNGPRQLGGERLIRPVPQLARPIKLDLAPRKSVLPSRLARRALPSAKLKAGAVQEDQLVFLNNNTLSGRFLGFEAGKALRWQHPAVKTPILIDPASLQQITVKSINLPKAARRHTCSIELMNGDELLGDLVSLEAGTPGKPGHLVLDTWYAGKLKIPFDILKTISPGTNGNRIIYEGPRSIEGWATGTQAAQMAAGIQIQQRAIPLGIRGGVPGGGQLIPGKPNRLAPNQGLPGDRALAIAGRVQPATISQRWRYSNGSFYSQGNSALIGRNFELPGKVNIEFDLAWQGYFSMGLNVFTDTFSQYSGNAYSLRLDSSNAYMYRMVNGSSGQMGRVRSGMQNPLTKAHISLRIDKEQKNILLFVNGTKLGSWKETSTRAFAGKGKGLAFFSRNSQRLRISKIRISVWDGSLPDGTAVTAGNGKDDFLLFGNNDSMSGELMSIQDGKVQLQAEFGKINVAMKRISRIDMKHRKTDLANPLSRARLRNRGRMAISIKKWTPEGVEVESPAFGTATLSPAVFTSIEFNLDQPRVKTGGDDPFFP